MDKIKYNQNMQSLRLHLIYVFHYTILWGIPRTKGCWSIISFIQSCRHGWMTFYYYYQRCKKKIGNTIHIKTQCFFFVLPVWSTKHQEVKRFWFLYKKDSRHIWNCQLLDFSRLLFQYCKHQPPCNVEIKTIRSFGWIS